MNIAAYIIALEEALGVNFKDKQLLLRALTHRSYLNEYREERFLGHNERLEFLGDAILEWVVTEYLYRTLDASTPEGALTNIRAELVNTTSLMDVACQLQIPNFLRMSRGQQRDEESGTSRTRLPANALEAVIGALYIDRGKLAAEAFILDTIIPRLRGIMKKGTSDWKSKFQELVQEREGITPHYTTIKSEGPDHAKHYTVALHVGKRVVALGSGPSKKLAQTDAAIRALSEYGE